MKTALKTICAALIALALSVQAFAAFSDVDTKAWYARPVETLSEMGAIDGYNDGRFGPDDTLEAVQFLKILGMIFYPEEIRPQAEDEGWGERFYEAALEHEIIDEELVSRDEMYSEISRYKVAAVVSCIMSGLMAEDIAAPDEVAERIGDYEEIPEEYAAAVKTVYAAGVIGGCDDKGTFKGEDCLTRAQAATVIFRMLMPEERLIDGKPPQQPDPEPEPEQPVVTPVDDEWFSNTMFLGDSLTHGLSLYSGLKTPTYYISTGASVGNIRSRTLQASRGGNRTFSEAIVYQDWDRIVIMLGINGLGSSVESYIAEYGALIDAIRAVRPDIEICIQSMLPVTRGKASQGFSISMIQTKNTALAQLAREKNCMYIDVYSDFADSEGYLPSEYAATWDGAHLREPIGYVKWADYLRNNMGG